MERYRSKETNLPVRIRAQAPEREQTVADHRERVFFNHFVRYRRPADAAIHAGYSERSAASTASQLLNKPKIKRWLQEFQDRERDRTQFSVEKLVDELGKLANATMEDYTSYNNDGEPFIDLSSLSPDQWAAIQEVVTETYMDGGGPAAREVKRVKIKLYDKQAAIQKIAVLLGYANRKNAKDGWGDDDEQTAQVSYTLNIGGNAAIQITPDGTTRILSSAGEAVRLPPTGVEPEAVQAARD